MNQRPNPIRAIPHVWLTSALAGALAMDGGLALAQTPVDVAEPAYQLRFSYPNQELIGDLLESPRGDPREQASVPHAEWYDHGTRKRWGAWGPTPRRYPPLEGLSSRPVEWKRERVIAVAHRFIGYGYQHHHVPDWNPPTGWPWKETCVGHNGKGVDCSNLTSFVFNQGFGVHLSSDVHRQSQGEPPRNQAIGHRLHHIALPERFEQRVETLKTGDLVYIRGRVDGPITHVVLWVGSIGRSREGWPLIIDSHGGDVKDDDGRPIPCGVHVRPFREKSWYNRCASHAFRVFE